MTDPNRSNDALAQEILELVDAQVCGCLTPEMLRRLDDLLVRDAEARRLYVASMQDAYHLHRLAAYALASEKNEIFPEGDPGESELGDDWFDRDAGTGVGDTSWLVHDLPPVGTGDFMPSFVGGALFSYLMAMLTISTGLLVGWYWEISTTPMVARRDVLNKETAGSNVRQATVAWITGATNCQWAERAVPAQVGRRIGPGRRLALKSGLLEIAYDGGAQVILQGPATYVVQSADAGYLAAGKLTVLVEKKGEGKEEEHERLGGESNPQPPIPDPTAARRPLFTVKTPTATVADLGTEFGIEVDERGSTTSQVFRGEVLLTSVGADGALGPQQRLSEGEAVCVDAGQRRIARITFDSVSFVRAAECRPPARLIEKSWRVTTHFPGPGWERPQFDDAKWLHERTLTGDWAVRNPNGEVHNSPWSAPRIWLRQEFTVDGPIDFKKASLAIIHDQDAEVFVNGTLILAESTRRKGPATFDVTERLRAALHEGVNVIAARVERVLGRQRFDLAISLDPKTKSPMPPAPLRLTPWPSTLVAIPMAEAGRPTMWRWTDRKPGATWTLPSFDDRSWAEGLSGFGVAVNTDPASEMPASVLGTSMSADEVWLRKTVDLSAPERFRAVLLQVVFDDDVKVYVNGRLVFANASPIVDTRMIDITDRVEGVLRPGANVVAIKILNTGGPKYVDAGLILCEEPASFENCLLCPSSLRKETSSTDP